MLMDTKETTTICLKSHSQQQSTWNCQSLFEKLNIPESLENSRILASFDALGVLILSIH